MKRDEIKEQYNTSHEASSTVGTEPVRVAASETIRKKRNRRRGVLIRLIMFGLWGEHNEEDS